MYKLSKTSISRRAGIDSRLIEIDDLAITLTKVDYGHPEYAGKRTDAEQLHMYKTKVSQCDGIIDRSYHQDGLALDFYAFVDGKASWHPPHLAMVACAYFEAANRLGYKIAWGGHWSTKEVVEGVGYGWDAGHIQLVED